MHRCAWATGDLLTQYHDEEWGVPIHDESRLFELLILEGMQAGLSWELILRKRNAYRAAFDGFDPEQMAAYDQNKIDELLGNSGIVRNRLKIEAGITNAHAYLNLSSTLNDFVWDFVDGKSQLNRWRVPTEVPCKTSTSDALSKALIASGFKFVGSKICYSFMQAVGMVCDHTLDCFRHPCNSFASI